MKIIVTILVSILIFGLQAPVVLAADWKEDQAQADQYYEAGEYKKGLQNVLQACQDGRESFSGQGFTHV